MEDNVLISIIFIIFVICFMAYGIYVLVEAHRYEKKRKLDFTVFKQNILPGNYYMLNEIMLEENPFKDSIDYLSSIYRVEDVRTSLNGSKWTSGYFLGSKNGKEKVYELDTELFDNYTQVYPTDTPYIIYKDLVKEIRDNLYRKPDDWRYGQFVFNYIETKYRLGYKVKEEKGIDCYNDDSKVEKFLYNVVWMTNEWYTKNNTSVKKKPN